MRSRRARRWRALGPRAWGTIAHAWLLLAGVRLALRVASPARVIAWALATPLRPEDSDKTSRSIVRRTARLSAMAARWHALPMSCLPQSIVVGRLLARRGIRTTIRFGARVENGRLSAHAWTAWRNRVITGGPDSIAGLAPLEPVSGPGGHAPAAGDRDV